jgi:hypothetical protein
MNTYPRVTTRSRAVPFPVTAFSPHMTAKRDSSWRSALLQRFDAIHVSEMDHVVLLRFIAAIVRGREMTGNLGWAWRSPRRSSRHTGERSR